MNQNGTIKQIINDKAVVSVKRRSACGDNCAHCSMNCETPTIDVKADLIDGLNVGDTVEIYSEDINVLKYALVLYGVPLILMVGIIFITSLFFKGEYAELYSGLCGIASLLISFFILKIYNKKETEKHDFRYIIKRKVEN